ncbi:TOM (translocase of outer membrane) complex component [Rhizina undulata]
MSSEGIAPLPSVQAVAIDPSTSAASASLFTRLSAYVSEHKAAVFTVGAAVVIASAGSIYYISQQSKSETSGKDKDKKTKKRRKEKEAKDNGAPKDKAPAEAPKVEEVEETLPEVDETTVETLSAEQRKDYAALLKAAGNKAYGNKSYDLAITLYSKAILCKPDPIFYSNRSACYNAQEQWEKVVEDTTAAIAMDPEYVKALNRRAAAYEKLEKYSDALLDFTASCIIDGFRNEGSAQSVERLLKKVAEAKGKAMLAAKQKKLPSSTFVSNYLQSFRSKAPPAGLEESANLDENSGDYHLRAGLAAVERKTAQGYGEAADAFEKAMELGTSHEAFALNWRGTFKYLRGDSADALADLSKSIELEPTLTQSYIKRASMSLEIGDREAAAKDFEIALEHNPDDPDIYYHRAQLHFILGEFAEAAKDYQKSIDLDRDFIFSHIQLGVTQYKMGSIASSMATFRRCIKNFDQVPDVYNYYGELLLDQQKFAEAIEKFDTAVEMEKTMKPMGMNVLPLINKALALFQWKQEFSEAEQLCKRALILDPDCDIAVATMAQLLLQQGRVTEALEFFEKAAELSRTEAEIVNALSYAEATRTQLEVQEKYPQLANKLQGMAGFGGR